jgi:hypothetical protein
MWANARRPIFYHDISRFMSTTTIIIIIVLLLLLFGGGYGYSRRGR